MSIKICQPSNSRTTAGAAMWWKNVCLYLDSINILRNANGKINLHVKEELKPVVKEMLFGSSGSDWPFSKSFASVLGGQIVTACVLVVFPLRDRSI